MSANFPPSPPSSPPPPSQLSFPPGARKHGAYLPHQPGPAAHLSPPPPLSQTREGGQRWLRAGEPLSLPSPPRSFSSPAQVSVPAPTSAGHCCPVSHPHPAGFEVATFFPVRWRGGGAVEGACVGAGKAALADAGSPWRLPALAGSAPLRGLTRPARARVSPTPRVPPGPHLAQVYAGGRLGGSGGKRVLVGAGGAEGGLGRRGFI